MLKLALTLACVGLALTLPAKLDQVAARAQGYSLQPPQQSGYNYEPPQQPANLYEVPAEPSGLYETPSTAAPAPPPPPPPPPPPSGLYETPQASDPRPVKTPAPTTTAAPAMMAGMPYDFGWGVDDPDSGNQFSQKEESDGNVVRGEYRVLLPDGRLQVVRYYDDGSGFNVDITYE
ncbi:cuticle protein 19-like [Penaeus vannamei]|uniref:cuticle protein 19-like n=1 Tax=Penaeus vannamei TaxID=6689 RepID=UPI00387F59FC